VDVVGHFAGWDLPPRDLDYLRFHRHRYAFLVSQVRDVVAQQGSPTILDVAPLFQTELLRVAFPNAVVNSLGFGREGRGWGLGRERTQHWPVDLNDADRDDCWPSLPPHDVVVMAEVMEHLHVAPEHLLTRLHSSLRAGGYLIIQTPNAAALPKRAALAFGRNPYQRLQPLRWDPGHIREYTRNELHDLARRTGFHVHELTLANYFEPDSRKWRLYNSASKWMPPTFRDGLTACLQKPL